MPFVQCSPGKNSDIFILLLVMFPTQHLMFIILDSKYVLVSFTEFSQTIEDGGFARVLETKDPNDHEVSVVGHEVCNSIAENMVLINKFNRLPQSGLASFTDNTLNYNFTIENLVSLPSSC